MPDMRSLLGDASLVSESARACFGLTSLIVWNETYVTWRCRPLEESPEIEAQIRRTLKSVFRDHDIATVTNLARGSRDPRSRMVLTAEDDR